jgi:predicted ABC-type transport system involved in lysophospholipase L1 biosynthesis ATPase subunit
LLDGERLLSQHPDQCSGGELQRLALVAALAQKPALLVADEFLLLGQEHGRSGHQGCQDHESRHAMFLKVRK